MPRVFINYRRADSAAHANLLYDWIRERYGEDRVFKDIDSIEPGLDFVEAIENAIASTAVMLVVIGKEWLVDANGRRRLDEADDYVRLEVGAALKRNIRVIPILVEDAAMPRPEDLPEPLSTLSRRHAFDLSDGRSRADRAELLRRLDQILDLPERTNGSADIPQPMVAVAPKPVPPPASGPPQVTTAPPTNQDVTAQQAPRGWNWGAFLLSWIWGIGNGVWISLLTLVPFVGLVMLFVLGAKGNELAWRSKSWQSAEHFQRTQRTWAKVGVAVWVGLILLWFLIAASSSGSSEGY